MTLSEGSYIILPEIPGSSPLVSHPCRCSTLRMKHDALGQRSIAELTNPLPLESRQGKSMEHGMERQFGNQLGKDIRPSKSQPEKLFPVYFSKILSNFFAFQMYCIQGQTGPKVS